MARKYDREFKLDANHVRGVCKLKSLVCIDLGRVWTLCPPSRTPLRRIVGVGKALARWCRECPDISYQPNR